MPKRRSAQNNMSAQSIEEWEQGVAARRTRTRSLMEEDGESRDTRATTEGARGHSSRSIKGGGQIFDSSEAAQTDTRGRRGSRQQTRAEREAVYEGLSPTLTNRRGTRRSSGMPVAEAEIPDDAEERHVPVSTTRRKGSRREKRVSRQQQHVDPEDDVEYLDT
jgi:hypothetical protein